MKNISFDTILSQFQSSTLWGWHFIVPKDIAINFVKGNNRRVICTINDKINIHCALMPNKNDWFILTNEQTVKKLGVNKNSTITVTMTKDESQYGIPMPDEFREVLNQEPMVDTFFHLLTPGKQRSLLYIIGKVKSADIRIRKSLAIADHLKSNNGNIDYKLLNEAFKEYNKI